MNKQSTSLNTIKKNLPPFVKVAIKKVDYFLKDIYEQITGNKQTLVPPSSIAFFGGNSKRDNFKKIGEEFKLYFINLGHLQPNDKVLDVGCGIGRMAVPLTSYLSSEGEYQGFDIFKEGVNWCQKNITSKFPNFEFQLCDVYSQHYNPKGTCLAKDYKFNYKDNYFDLIFLTSVFTHMFPLDLENYLSEIARVLKPGGRCLITFFILNDESRKYINSGESSLDFKYEFDQGLTIDSNNPESAIAYEENFVRQLFAQYELTINEPIYFGSWCNRDSYLSYQDIIIATKK